MKPKRPSRRTAIALGVVLAVVAVGIGYFAFKGTGGRDVRSEPGLAWAPPDLHDPKVINVRQGQSRVSLDDERDYRVVLPCGSLASSEGLTISGGHNVVLVGGAIDVTSQQGDHGLYLVDQTGTVHVEGLHLKGNLNDGINLSQKLGAVVQLQNVLVDTVRGSREGHHADVLQTWAGPAELRVDNLVGKTNYQGLFLAPTQHYNGPPPRNIDLRNVQIVGDDQAGYSFWWSGDPITMQLSNVTATALKEKPRELVVWPRPDDKSSPWSKVTTTDRPDSATLSAETDRSYYDGLCS